jgi:cytochrome b561
VLIAAVLGLVFVREGIDEKALRTTLINLHRSLGLCVALLAVVRIAVRLAKRPLPPTADASPLEHFVAMAVHLALYVLMFALPLIGWALSSANGKAVSFFGLFTCRRWSSRTKTWRRVRRIPRARRLAPPRPVGAHAAAALAHHFIKRDGVLRAMLPVWLAGRRS